MNRQFPWFLLTFLVAIILGVGAVAWDFHRQPRNGGPDRPVSATDRRTEDARVRKAALRAELQGQTVSAPGVEELARAVVRLDPDDPEAHFALAQVDFEQVGTPPDERRRARVLQAAEHLAVVKRLQPATSWRVLALEVQVRRRLRDAAVRAGDARGAASETRLVWDLLLDPKSGVVARTPAEPALGQLAPADAASLLTLHVLAVEEQLHALHAAGAGHVSSAEQLIPLLDATSDLARRLTARPDGNAELLADAAGAVVQAVAKCQTVLTANNSAAWHRNLDTASELTQAARDRDLGHPSLYALLADILCKDMAWQASQDVAGNPRFTCQAPLHWAEAGLQVGRAQKRSDAELEDLHALAAELKTVAQQPGSDVTGHLAILEQSVNPQHRARAGLLRGAVAYREGRLEAAALLLERAVAASPTDAVLRAYLLLGNACLALRQPEKALHAYEKAATALERQQRLTGEEKQWLQAFVGTPLDLTCLRVQAHLDVAWLKAAQLQNQPPREDSLREGIATQIRFNETQAARLANQLPRGPHQSTARLQLAAHRLRRGDRDLCEQELQALRANYPGDAEVVRMELVLLTTPSDGDGFRQVPLPVREKADGMIRNCLAANPANAPARLLWAEWLIQSGRGKEGLAYLDSLGKPQGARADRQTRFLRATALMREGDRAGSLEVLRHLPYNSQAETALAPFVVGVDASLGPLADLLSHHTDGALAHFAKGWQCYQEGDFGQSAREFLAATDYAHLETDARHGLRLALFGLARQDGAESRRFLAELLASRPDDPDLLLAAAYCHLLLDDLGDTRPPGGEPRDLASDLQLWEAALRKKRQFTVSAPLTRAEFWIAAGRPDLARIEANRAVREQPQNSDALLLAANLALDANDPAALAEGIALVTTLRKLQVRSPQVLLLQAELERRQGHRTAALHTYETLLKEHRQYAVGYARMIEALEDQGMEREVGLWLPYWRGQMPNHLLGVQAEVRFLLKNNLVARAREVAEAFTRNKTAFMLPTATDDGKFEAFDADAHFNDRVTLAATFVAGKAWAEAEAWCQRLLAERPDHEAALLLLGDVYLGRMAESNGAERARWRQRAKDSFAAVLTANPGQLDAANNLAWLLVREENQPEKAYQVLQDARTRKGTRPPMSAPRLPAEFLDTLGQTYLRMDNRAMYAEMRVVFETALPRYPHDARVLLHLGRAYAATRNVERAEELFARALQEANTPAANGLSAAEAKAVRTEIGDARRRLGLDAASR